MSLADMGRTSLKNNKRKKVKMFESFNKAPEKRKYKSKEKNPHIKNMSKKELKAYRKELQAKASQRMKNIWLGIFSIFFVMFFYFLFKS